MEEKKVVAVYSGSFNPLHVGHYDIIQALHDTPWIDKVLVVVSPKNPGKSERLYIQTPTERLQAVQEMILRYGLSDKVEASDIEFSREQPIWTVDTLLEIKALYPSHRVVYVCGMDCLEKIQRWRRGDIILQDLLVFQREGYNGDEIIKSALEKYPDSNIETLDVVPRNVSSTYIREKMQNGEEDYKELIP